MNNSFAGRVENHTCVIQIVDADGHDPEGAFYWAAREAIDLAAEFTGALACHPSDGDVYLDFEGGEYTPDGLTPGAALGIIVAHLAHKGFPVLVVDAKACPACEHTEPRDPKCPTCGGKGTVDNRAF